MGIISLISMPATVLITLLVANLWQKRTGGSHTAFRPLPWWCNITGLTLLLLGIVVHLESDSVLRLSICTLGLLFMLLSRDRKPSNIDLPFAISFACTLLVTIGHMLIAKSDVPFLHFAITVLLVHIACRYVLRGVKSLNQLTTNNITTKTNTANDKGACPLA